MPMLVSLVMTVLDILNSQSWILKQVPCFTICHSILYFNLFSYININLYKVTFVLHLTYRLEKKYSQYVLLHMRALKV